MSSSRPSVLSQKYSREQLYKARDVLDSLVPECGMPLYTSIDIRDSGYRIVAVDVNLFPAGFNNLSAHTLEKGAQKFKDFFQKKLKTDAPWKIGLLPESHTNNEGYLKNIQTLSQMLEAAGAEVKLAWTGLPIPKAWELKTGENKLTYLPAAEVTTWADALVLNHDLSGGLLESLKDFSRPVFPSPDLGWHKRKKSEHFDIARKVLTRVAAKVDIDPSDFLTDSVTVEDLSFDKKEDIEKLIEASAQFFEKLNSKPGASDTKPFVYVKNDSGTYGLGIWSFSSLDELKGATKLIQKKFQRGKQGTFVKRVILQEGIRTRFVSADSDAVESEPVVYSVNGARIGAFLRCAFRETNSRAGELNLNRPNAWFEDETRLASELSEVKDLYCFVTQLHSVAAAIEDCPCEADL